MYWESQDVHEGIPISEAFPGLERRKRHRTQAVRLSQRELEVLRTLWDGLTSREAAEVLFISSRTVDYHLANIFAKLRAKNRLQAFRSAQRYGLMPFEPSGVKPSVKLI